MQDRQSAKIRMHDLILNICILCLTQAVDIFINYEYGKVLLVGLELSNITLLLMELFGMDNT